MAINEEHLSDLEYVTGINFKYKGQQFSLQIAENIVDPPFTISHVDESRMPTMQDLLTGKLQESRTKSAMILWNGEIPKDRLTCEAMDTIIGFLVEQGTLKFGGGANMDLEAYKQATDEMQSCIERFIGQKPVVIYSAYPTDEDGVPINNLNDVPIEGSVRFELRCDEMFPSDEGEDYMSPIVIDPNWLLICKYADEALRKVGDTHHVFLEYIEVVSDKDGIQTAKMVFGS